jgi:acetoin utilization deacetylase AcuC-like enzyme
VSSPPPVLLLTHERYLDHDIGRGHPERPDRLRAVLAGVEAAGLDDALTRALPRPATTAELARVHDEELISSIERSSAEGGGWLDADTATVEASYDAALLAAGAGLSAVEALDAGEAEAAFCAVRPPGHHATPVRSMGFCLFNNVAVTAAALAERGERVLVVDYDAHHGNGTQEVFWTDRRVAYVSYHQFPLYPGTGGLREVGEGDGHGTTVNLPLPAGATGDAYLAGVDEVLAPFAAAFRPTWLLISAGFDAHRADPITDLGLSAGDYADLTAALLELVPAGRRIVFLEGGYDLEALAASAAACVGAMAGQRIVPEPPSGGGPGRDAVTAAALVHAQVAREQG